MGLSCLWKWVSAVCGKQGNGSQLSVAKNAAVCGKQGNEFCGEFSEIRVLSRTKNGFAVQSEFSNQYSKRGQTSQQRNIILYRKYPLKEYIATNHPSFDGILPGFISFPGPLLVSIVKRKTLHQTAGTPTVTQLQSLP